MLTEHTWMGYTWLIYTVAGWDFWENSVGLITAFSGCSKSNILPII